jgi:hypothetical protein
MTNKQQEIALEICRVAEEVKPQLVTQQLFRRFGRIPLSTVSYNFGSWNKAVTAAGLTPNPSGIPVSGYKTLDEAELLNAIGELWLREGRRPVESLMSSEGKFSAKPYRDRWGSFPKAVDEYVRRFGEPQSKVTQSESAAKLELSDLRQATRKLVVPETIKPTSTVPKKKVFYGEPLGFRGLQYAPVNEQGVVYLFGMVSRELGFLIESVRTDFPDCEGKRMTESDGTKWQHVRIEFEYRSRNFEEHGHNPDNCDLVVCWIHDWAECPLEVLELRSNMKRLAK